MNDFARNRLTLGVDAELAGQPVVADDDDHRGDGEDRDGLRRDDPRHQAAVEAAGVDDQHRQEDAEEGTQTKPASVEERVIQP